MILKVKHNGLKISEGQWMSLSNDSTRRTACITTTLTTSKIPMCNVYEATIVFFGIERLIPYQGEDSNSLLHRTLTKSRNKSMLNDQASIMTLLMCWHS
jgi:hypothetical protein